MFTCMVGLRGGSMNVYLLIEETDQDEFVDRNGDSAAAFSTIVGVYESRERAEKEQNAMEEMSKRNEKELGCDPLFYFIEERPIL